MAKQIQGTVITNGTATLMARLVGWNGAAITQADVSAVTYTVYAVGAKDPAERTADEDHEGVPLTVAAVVYDELQTDAVWTADATGYNFRHTVPITGNPAFADPQRQYVVEYTLTPTTGEPIVVSFLLRSV